MCGAGARDLPNLCSVGEPTRTIMIADHLVPILESHSAVAVWHALSAVSLDLSAMYRLLRPVNSQNFQQRLEPEFLGVYSTELFAVSNLRLVHAIQPRGSILLRVVGYTCPSYRVTSG